MSVNTIIRTEIQALFDNDIIDKYCCFCQAGRDC